MTKGPLLMDGLCTRVVDPAAELGPPCKANTVGRASSVATEVVPVGEDGDWYEREASYGEDG